MQAEAKKNKKETENIEAVLDYADMLTDEEEKALKKWEARFEKETGMHCFVIITENRKEYKHKKYKDAYKDSIAYNNAFYDTLVAEYEEAYEEAYEDCAILLLTLPKDRYALVSGYGELEYYLDGECDWIFENIKEDLSNDNYAAACKEYMNYVEDLYLTELEEESYDSELDDDLLWISLGSSCVIIVILLGRAGGVKTTTSRTYLDKNRSRVVGKYDNYIRTKTRRTRINDSAFNHSGGGGSSSSGSSGGGGTHGGGSF